MAGFPNWISNSCLSPQQEESTHKGQSYFAYKALLQPGYKITIRSLKRFDQSSITVDVRKWVDKQYRRPLETE